MVGGAADTTPVLGKARNRRSGKELGRGAPRVLGVWEPR